MPELPEVETVRRGLAPVMEGARFTKVIAHRGDLRWPLAQDFTARLEGKTVEGLGRRAERARATAGRRHQGRARGRDRGRRLLAARSPPHRRRARRFPARFPRLRPPGQTLPDAELHRHHQAHDAERPIDVFLPGVPALAAFAGSWRGHEILDHEIFGYILATPIDYLTYLC